MSTRSFDNATGSVTANVTPERSHASRVNASGSNPGGNCPGACARRVAVRGVCILDVLLLGVVSVMGSIPDRCAIKTTTSSSCLVFKVLYVELLLNEGSRRHGRQPGRTVPVSHRHRKAVSGGADSAPPVPLQRKLARGCRNGTPAPAAR